MSRALVSVMAWVVAGCASGELRAPDAARAAGASRTLLRGAAATRYQPITTHLASVPVIARAALDQGKLEALVVELYKLRNGFLHSGLHPYHDNIDLDGVTVTTGRVVRGARVLAKLAVADAFGFPATSERRRRTSVLRRAGRRRRPGTPGTTGQAPPLRLEALPQRRLDRRLALGEVRKRLGDVRCVDVVR